MNWMHRLMSDPEGRRLLEQERVLLEATEAICRLMRASNVTKSDLAERLGRSPAFVTKLLRGNNNFTLRTLADVFGALEASLHLDIGPAGDSVRVPDTESPNRVVFPMRAPRQVQNGQYPRALDFLPCDEEPDDYSIAA